MLVSRLGDYYPKGTLVYGSTSAPPVEDYKGGVKKMFNSAIYAISSISEAIAAESVVELRAMERNLPP